MSRVLYIFCLLWFISCGTSEKVALDFEKPQKGIEYTDEQNIEVLLNIEGDTDSVVVILNNQENIPLENNAATISADHLLLGENILVAKAYKGGKDIAKKYLLFQLKTNHTPTLWKPNVLRKIKHETDAFTQGLFVYEDKLYESTGERGHSRLMIRDMHNGEVLKETKLNGKYFGEGATVYNGQLYYITWTSGEGFIFNAETLQETAKFNYGKHTAEGWGLTTVGESLVMSNGSEKLLFFHPQTMQLYKTLTVLSDKGEQTQLNELEYDGTYLYANVWMTNEILVISPRTGRVEAIIDCSGLFVLEKRAQNNPMSDVLNGIAYRPETGTFFLTGKNWEHIYEVDLKK